MLLFQISRSNASAGPRKPCRDGPQLDTAHKNTGRISLLLSENTHFPSISLQKLEFPFRNWILGKRDIIRDFVSLETSQRNMNHTIQSMKATMKVKPRRPAGLYLTTPIQFSKQVIPHTLCNVLVVPKSGFLFRVS